MKLFSERYGYVKPRDAMQIESLDDELRIRIYNALHGFLKDAFRDDDYFNKATRSVWCDFWCLIADDCPAYSYDFFDELRNQMLKCPWYNVYDLLEFLAKGIEEYWDTDDRQVLDDPDIPTMVDDFSSIVNEALKLGNSGYRMMKGAITPITNVTELDSLEISYDLPDEFAGARRHVINSVTLLSQRPEPDPKNAVKEAICAVEAVARVVLGDDKATLGNALKRMRRELNLHPAMADGWSKIYGFTCDAGGIRHADVEGSVEVDLKFARYMVVTCSAFVNYLAEGLGERSVEA